MGGKSSKQKKVEKKEEKVVVAEKKPEGFYVIKDNYKTLTELQDGLRKAGLESSNLVISIDFTKSNEWSGKQSFGGRHLHTIDPTGAVLNPYQRAIDIIGRTLEVFDDDKLIPTYGFGDSFTADKAVFPFYPDEHPCHTVVDVLRRYTEITPGINLAGPTSFAPAIEKAISIVQREKGYHILIIIADGQVTSPQTTREALIKASEYPLSIVCIGVGDGPWDEMKNLDDGLPQRKFDNFQFVDFNEVMSRPRVENFDVEFATAALMEIPEQFAAIRKLKLL
eukprot:TRINITY_DN510_c0_g2_i1.p1 TRINITY_DN510_c0_g2~~TRINITY_DN510_c0_g2_i1.p1  ORF type:complete len:280 (+),score=84.07 TRINITY_DN510_c0_g2_i1:11-850(+)